jgi:hypothetical protein
MHCCIEEGNQRPVDTSLAIERKGKGKCDISFGLVGVFESQGTRVSSLARKYRLGFGHNVVNKTPQCGHDVEVKVDLRDGVHKFQFLLKNLFPDIAFRRDTYHGLRQSSARWSGTTCSHCRNSVRFRHVNCPLSSSPSTAIHQGPDFYCPQGNAQAFHAQASPIRSFVLRFVPKFVFRPCSPAQVPAPAPQGDALCSQPEAKAAGTRRD